jgi:site-specific recombinase XerD
VGIDEAAGAMVQHWIDSRKELGVSGKNPVFCLITTGKIGQPLDPSYVRHALKKAAVKAGIGKRVHPHSLRHSMASDLLSEGHNLTLIQAQLGHSTVATTDRYLRKIAPHELVAAMRARPWESV